MPKSKQLTEGDILKGILKKYRITQAELAKRTGYGRTKLNLSLGMSVLDEELKRLVIRELSLPQDTFQDAAPDEVEQPESAKHNLSQTLDSMLAQMQQLVAQNQEILNNQRQLFERLAA